MGMARGRKPDARKMRPSAALPCCLRADARRFGVTAGTAHLLLASRAFLAPHSVMKQVSHGVRIRTTVRRITPAGSRLGKPARFFARALAPVNPEAGASNARV